MRTIIEMARQAGISDWNCLSTKGCLGRFAAFVRADEREAMMQLFTDPENQPTQHGTVTVEYMMHEIAAEREACAKVCEAWHEWGTDGALLAKAIRARGNTCTPPVAAGSQAFHGFPHGPANA